MTSPVLITGASTGLGLALAKRLASDARYHLVLTARAGSLHRFAAAGVHEGERLWIRSLDVRSDAERRAIVREVERELGGVDVLVNNAGVAYRAVVEHVREEERLAQMEVNFRAPMELVRCVLPGMRERRRGRIVAISSVAGMMAMPTMAVYAASKFALEGAHEALYYETRPWGIHVTLVQPGFIRADTFDLVRRTALSERAEADAADPYHAHYASMGGFIERAMRRLAWSDHDDVARVVERTIRRASPPLRVLATPDARLFAALRRWLPRRLYHGLLYRMLPGVRSWGPASRRLELAAPEPLDG